MRLMHLSASLLLGLTLGGCATIISGTSQKITVNSDVEGADVFLNEQPLGKTPLIAVVDRGIEGVLSVQKPGHTPYQIALNKKINTVLWVNIFIGGTFGSTTDYTTGAMYEYEPSTFFASLRPSGQSAAEASAWEKREALRAFVLLNSEALVSDLAAGQGEYLDMLLYVMDVQPTSRTEAIERVRDMYSTSETSLQFAGKLVAVLPEHHAEEQH
jgi:hypothetical protein